MSEERYWETREYWINVGGETIYNAAFGLLPAWLPRRWRMALARRVANTLFYKPAARDGVGNTRLSRLLRACVTWLDAQDEATAVHVMDPNDEMGERAASIAAWRATGEMEQAIRAWKDKEAPDVP